MHHEWGFCALGVRGLCLWGLSIRGWGIVRQENEIFASGVGVLFISGRGLCIGDRTFLVIRGRVLSIRGRDFVHHG